MAKMFKFSEEQKRIGSLIMDTILEYVVRSILLLIGASIILTLIMNAIEGNEQASWALPLLIASTSIIAAFRANLKWIHKPLRKPNSQQ